MSIGVVQVDVTVLICTCNRLAFLERTLSGLEDVRALADLKTEILVVDNGSTDGTGAFLKDWERRSRLNRAVHESRPGKSYAQNLGIEESGAEVILFTDDDVMPSETWIDAMAAPVLRGDAEIVAGPVELAPGLLRDWMTDRLKKRLAWTPFESVGARRPASANLAVNAAAARQVGGFDIELGPGRLGFEDETLFIARMIEAGARLQWAGEDALVTHCPDEGRLARGCWLSDAEKLGRSAAYTDHHFRGKSKPLPLVRYAVNAARLELFRALNRTACRASEGITEMEWDLCVRNAYNLMRWRLRNDAPKYR